MDQSRIASETARIAELDKQVDDLLSYFFSTVKTGYNHPIEAKRTAARALQNVMKPYFETQSLPQRQQVQTVDSLLKDLKKDENKAHLTALGLSEELVYLEEMNAEYMLLIESRAASQVANPVESAKPIRTVMYDQYDEIVTTAWAFSIASPSDALTVFITKVNKLIADTNQTTSAWRNDRNQLKKTRLNIPILPVRRCVGSFLYRVFLFLISFYRIIFRIFAHRNSKNPNHYVFRHCRRSCQSGGDRKR